MTVTEHFDAAIIGSGIGGLCAAIRLKRAGLDVVVFERASEVGGTWRDNTYPGCAVDTSILSYSLSFDPNPGWSRLFAPWSELHAYLKGLAVKHDVRRRIRFDSTVTEMRYDEGQEQWEVSTADGDRVTSTWVVNACGLLSKPQVPVIPGLETFQGPVFHTARWQHDVDLEDKRVAVVGTGASAAQVVPAIAGQVRHLTVFQRSAPWVFPRNDKEIGSLEAAIYRYVPLALKARRWHRFWQNDRVQFGFERQDKTLESQKQAALAHIDAQIADPALRAKVTPDYLVGCKRRVMSDDYYPALTRPNVSLVTERVAAATGRTVVDGAGDEHEVDVIIFGTGFAATDFLSETKVFGLGGRELHDVWADGARTHKSLTVSGFPNMFFVMGPNTGIGAGSAAFVIESQVNYVLGAIKHLKRTGAAALDLRPEVLDRSYGRLQQRLSRSVYGSGCDGWYQQGPDGHIDTVYPGPLTEYWFRTRFFDRRAYRLRRAAAPVTAPVQPTFHEEYR